MPKKIKHIITVLIVGCLLFLCSGVEGQYNLVPNYSFETYTNCPTYFSPPPPPWYCPSNVNNAPYMNSCASVASGANVPYNGVWGFQYARTGGAYLWMVFRSNFGKNVRSYIQTKLKDSLLHGHCYYCEFFVSLSESNVFGCNNVSMAITKNQIWADTVNAPYGVIPFNPQIQNVGNPVIMDSINWVKVSGVYVAQGGEQYITIGNFENDTNTIVIHSANNHPSAGKGAVYYLDDVSVIPLDSMPLKADAGRDTTIRLGDSVFIGSLTNGLTGVVWYDANNAIITSAIGVPGFYVKPPLSTFYVIEQTVCGYYSRDTVWVNVNPLPVIMLNFECYILNGGSAPSPLSTGLREERVGVRWQTATEVNVSHFNILRSVNGKDFMIIGKVGANNKPSAYTFNDPLTTNYSLLTTLYYRLEIIDKDGSKTYSTIQHINLSTHQELRISPNPAREFVSVYYKSMKEIRVIDNIGRVIIRQIPRQAPRDDVYTLGIQHLPKGLYLVQVITTNGEMKTGKLVVSD